MEVIIFDLDGTLLNTLDDLADSTNYALKKCGYPKRTIAEVRRFVGNGIRKLIERALPAGAFQTEIEKVLSVFSSHYETNKNNKTRPYKGVVELVARLKAEGKRMAVVSNKYDSAVKSLVSDLFGDNIDLAIGESNEIRPKPAPDGVLKALIELKGDKTNAVYVGDSDVDMQTARNSCINAIGVSWGFRDRNTLEDYGAVIADNVEELYELLK